MKIQQIFATALLGALSSCGGNAQQAEQAQQDIAPLAIYAQYCSGCHGEDGKMGLGGAKDLSASSLSREEVEQIVKNGSANKKMMAYGNVLSEAELRALSEYVVSLRKP